MSCCDEDFGGSHYHCPRCGAVCSMMGHTPIMCRHARQQGRDRPERAVTEVITTPLIRDSYAELLMREAGLRPMTKDEIRERQVELALEHYAYS